MPLYFPKKLDQNLITSFFSRYYSKEFIIKDYADRILLYENSIQNKIFDIIAGRYSGVLNENCFEIKEKDTETYEIKSAFYEESE